MRTDPITAPLALRLPRPLMRALREHAANNGQNPYDAARDAIARGIGFTYPTPDARPASRAADTAQEHSNGTTTA